MHEKYKYDVIVIGSGNGGLISAARMAKQGMKVLILEKHNIPGGFASSFVRGRFEFEPSLHELGAIGNENNKGCVYQLFENLGIDIEWCQVPELFCLINKNDDGTIEKFDFPFGIEEFSKKMDFYFSNSYTETKRFIEICYELYECAMNLHTNKGNVSTKILKKYFPDFLTTGSYTLQEVIDNFKLCEKAKNLLCSYCCYLGLPPNKLNFTLYAIMLAEYIKFGAYIPKNRSHEISSKIVKKILDNNGEIWYNNEVVKIIVENNQTKGVILDDGTIIHANFVVANISPNIVYGQMIDKQLVPKYDHKLVNYRRLNVQGYSIYLGLNIDAKTLGLDKYSYFVFSNMNQNKVFEDIKNIDINNNYIVLCLNVANLDASEKGTCILSFTTLYDDAWNDVNEYNYVDVKEKIALRMIKDFEQKMNINILDHIEEIEIATPMTFARYTNAQNGVIYGYSPLVKDGIIVRSKYADYEINIKGLRFAGGYSFRTHGYSTTYMSGDIVGWKTFAEWKKEL